MVSILHAWPGLLLPSPTPISAELKAPFLHKKRIMAPRCFSHGLSAPLLNCTIAESLGPVSPDVTLINEDLKPTALSERTFTVWDMNSLWVGLVVGIPSYYLAGSLVAMGMAWWQGILTIMAGNIILLFPLILTGHAGTKYGIPFPVLCRASFGIHGAHVPTFLRTLVACGWFGIETWIGGQSFFVLFNALFHGRLTAAAIPWLGTSIPELVCFFLFWLLQVAIVWNGVESIRKLEKYSAPLLIILSAALLTWAYLKAGGFGTILSLSSQFGPGGALEGQFWQVFFPALSANIGFWATLSLNITDFTRYARTQADQIFGQMGLPFFMGAFSFLGLAVTSSTELIFGHIISSPIELLSQIGGILPILLSIVGVTVATLTTNIAANIVAPANALINFSPKIFSFSRGALLTAVLGVLFMPWRLMQSSESFVNSWLLGYSAFLGPLGGIILADYYVLRHQVLDINGLYSLSYTGPYWYYGGYNPIALLAYLLSAMPGVPGFLYTVGLLKEVTPIFLTIYNNAWLFGILLSGFLYWALSALSRAITSNH